MYKHGWLLTAVATVVALVGLVQSDAVMAQDWGVIRYAHKTVNIRAARSTQSRIVGQLKPGHVVKSDFSGDGWFAVFPLDSTVRNESLARGYVYASLLKPNPYQPPTRLSSAAESSQYRIAQREDVSYRGSQRMVFRVQINSQDVPSEATMRTLATRIWNDGNRGWDEFTVFLYLPGMKTNSVAYGIGEFGKSGLKDFNINKWSKP